MALKAFEVRTPRLFPDMVSIYAAESAGKARYTTLRGAENAGYHLTFMEIQAKRRPEFDEIAARSKGPQSIGWWDKDLGASGCLIERALASKS